VILKRKQRVSLQRKQSIIMFLKENNEQETTTVY